MSGDTDLASSSARKSMKPTGASSTRFKANITVRMAAIVGEAAQGNVERVKELLRSMPNGTEHKVKGVTALHVASRNGHFETVKLLLAARTYVNCVDDRGQTALHHAAEGHQAAIVDLLLRSGALIDAMNVSKETALHVAVKHSWLDCVEMLLKHGCDVNLRGSNGLTALHYALEYANGREGRCLPSSANDRITEMLVTAPNVDLSVKGFNDESYLHHAASVGHRFGVELLTIHAEELLRQRDETGWTALHTAVECRHYDICETLIMCAPFLVNEGDENGDTALPDAVQQRECSLVELMVSMGGNCNIKDSWGSTCLHLAFESDFDKINVENSESSLEKSPEINEILTQLNNIGETSIGLAIGCYLIRDAYADVNVQNKSGRTPLDILEERQSTSYDKLKQFVMQMVKVREEKVKQRDVFYKSMSQQLEYLKLKLTNLEDEHRCQICMDRSKNVVFLCGHGACQTCAQVLNVCHICRKTITNKITCH